MWDFAVTNHCESLLVDGALFIRCLSAVQCFVAGCDYASAVNLFMFCLQWMYFVHRDNIGLLTGLLLVLLPLLALLSVEGCLCLCLCIIVWYPKTPTGGFKAVTRIYFRRCWGMTQRSPRPERPRRGGILRGGGQQAPTPLAMGLGMCCKLPQLDLAWSYSQNWYPLCSSVVIFENFVTNKRSVFVCQIFRWNFAVSNRRKHPLVTALD